VDLNEIHNRARPDTLERDSVQHIVQRKLESYEFHSEIPQDATAVFRIRSSVNTLPTRTDRGFT
tara:strand:- start:517 stop:708 length:192 start_codon:yes stop_codon:yes gene_type:complete